MRSSWPAASALATWRCDENQSNQSGNSVTTSRRRAQPCWAESGARPPRPPPPGRARSRAAAPGAPAAPGALAAPDSPDAPAPLPAGLAGLAVLEPEEARVHDDPPRRRRRPPVTASPTIGTSSSPTSSASHDGSARRSSTTPSSRPSARHDVTAAQILRPVLALAERGCRRPRDEQVGAAQRLGAGAVVDAEQAQDRPVVGAGAPHDLARGVADAHLAAEQQQRRPRPRHVKRAVEAVRTADATGVENVRSGQGGAEALSRDGRPTTQSTMSTNTRHCSLTAAAFSTVRRALAVRPPRPMTLP